MDRLKYIKLENEDGSYSSSIPLAVDSDYVDVNGNPLTDELNNKANSSSIVNLQNQINSLASGSPLVASSTSEMTDTTRIYVNTTDGKWYYYDGDSWEIGGTYQSSQLSDEVLAELDNTAKTTTINLINPDECVDGMLNGDGTIVSGAAYKTTDYIEVESSTEYTIQENYRIIGQFNSNKKMISGTYSTTEVTTSNNVITTHASAKYLRFTFYKNDTIPSIYKGNQLYNYIIPYEKVLDKDVSVSANIKNYISDNCIGYTVGDNLFDISKIKENWGIWASTGTGRTFDHLNTSPIIKVNPNSNLVFNNAITKLLQYDRFMSPIQITYDNSDHSAGYTFTTTANTYYIRFTYNENQDEVMLSYGTTPPPYKPYQKKIEDNVILSDSMKNEITNYIESKIGNPLYKKKITYLGDSFTAYTNDTFDSGIYNGECKVYPYLIGLRNDMIVNNMAIAGSCMTYGYGSVNSCMDMYTSIPTDSNYIIIKYGINDENYAAPLGSINDNVNNTFYGAYNTLMQWIYANCPFAKVGIIVTNGLNIYPSQDNNNKYANAIIEIAKKYGIATLNEWNDNNIPLLSRTGRTDTNYDIRTSRNNAFRISSADTHPNYQAQEFESYIIEDFIKRL